MKISGEAPGLMLYFLLTFWPGGAAAVWAAVSQQEVPQAPPQLIPDPVPVWDQAGRSGDTSAGCCRTGGSDVVLVILWGTWFLVQFACFGEILDFLSLRSQLAKNGSVLERSGLGGWTGNNLAS